MLIFVLRMINILQFSSQKPIALYTLYFLTVIHLTSSRDNQCSEVVPEDKIKPPWTKLSDVCSRIYIIFSWLWKQKGILIACDQLSTPRAPLHNTNCNYSLWETVSLFTFDPLIYPLSTNTFSAVRAKVLIDIAAVITIYWEFHCQRINFSLAYTVGQTQ